MVVVVEASEQRVFCASLHQESDLHVLFVVMQLLFRNVSLHSILSPAIKHHVGEASWALS